MNRIVTALILISVLLAGSAFAQITITARDVPRAPGLQFQYYSESGDSIPVNVGVPGGPQTWDFTTGSTANTTTDLYLDPATAPPQYSRANVIIETDEINFSGLNEPGKMYCYLHPMRFILGALETTYEGQTVDFALTPYITQYTLPMNMGNTWTNTLDLDEIFEFPDYDIRIELHATMDSQVDAYGTMNVPAGSYDVLRIRNLVNYNLTVYIRILWVWVPILEDASNGINYDWRAIDTGSVVTITSQTTDPYFSYAKSVRRLMNADNTAASTASTIGAAQPESMALLTNYPNPFNGETVISYELAQSAEVDLRIFDLLGRQVAQLADGYQDAGQHNLTWSPADLSAGVYLLQLRAGGVTQRQMMVYMK